MTNTCKHGHVNPERRKNGNCIPCEKQRIYSEEHFERSRQASRDRKKDPGKNKRQQEYMREYYLNNPEKRKRYNEVARQKYFSQPERRMKQRLRRLGIKDPSQQLLSYLINHNNLCDICGQPDTGRWKELCIDHCHQTMEVRGMLCHNCNHALGKFQDNSEILWNAIQYLIQYRKTVPNEAKMEGVL